MDIAITASSVTIKQKKAEGAIVSVDFNTVVGIDQWRAETRDGSPLLNNHHLSEVDNDKYFMAEVYEPLYLVLRGGRESIEMDIAKAMN